MCMQLGEGSGILICTMTLTLMISEVTIHSHLLYTRRTH